MKTMKGEKVYYQFPASMDAGAAARAYMNAAGGVHERSGRRADGSPL